MKNFLLIIPILLLNSLVLGQEELSEKEKICKKAAIEVMSVYDNWDSSRDYNVLYPRIKAFVDDYFESFPDYSPDLVEKEKVGKKLTSREMRVLVAYKALKEDIYDEISRFVSNKNFYWGYIDEETSTTLKGIAKELGDFSRERKDEILKEQAVYVNDLLEEMRKYERQLDSLKTVSDVKLIDDLLEDESYNREMLALEIRKNSIKSQDDLEELDKKIVQKLQTYFEMKRSELIDRKRTQLIETRDYWVEEKRVTLFDLLNYEQRVLNKIVSGFMQPMIEERNIGNYDISNDFIMSVKNETDDMEEKFKEQLRFKYFSGLTGKFGFYLQYDLKPVFRTFRFNVLIGTILFMILFFYIYIKVKRNRESLFIRRIPGLDAIDDAVGRATEMGKPIVYDAGIGYYTNIDTIASMLILRSVARKVAEFKAEIYVPTHDPIIMQISEEMVASGFLDAGYPEDHKKDNIFFLAADQFAFAAGVSGILARKKPATAFHFGYYAAESLLISEAGFSAGAIQVAGTTAVSQLPFFITACDYTLIGEELYAAAAYISRDAQIMTNLKLSDFAKVVIGVLFILGTILLTINPEWTILQDIIYTR
ncbi:MAG: DUF6754 domain-containing protein [Candidatus Delongbacteria bacterium]